MGTDIHLYVERRVGDKWVSCDKWEPDEYREENEPERKTVRFGNHYYSDRNYNLFGILADVRNGRGFAGVDMGDGFIPIAEPRGLPGDLSPELAVEVKHHLEHTPTWLLLSEIMAYDWEQVSTCRGIVSAHQYAKWSGWNRGRGEAPAEYCGGISGPLIEVVPESELKSRLTAFSAKLTATDPSIVSWKIADRVKEEMPNVYCQVSWRVPYYKAADDFLSTCVPRLWKLGKPEDVRLVFWFDS